MEKPKRKRGRPPIGDRAMTPMERRRRQLDKQVAERLANPMPWERGLPVLEATLSFEEELGRVLINRDW